MSSQDGDDRRITRRRFLGWAGTIAAAGALLSPADVLRRFDLSAASQGPTSNQTSLGNVVPEGSFSIFWMTDTQFLAECNASLFKKTTKWIVDNWAPFNGKLVVHTGDMVQDGAVQSEWVTAEQAMSTLLANGIPYTWCAGNHDDLVNGDQSSGWKGHMWTAAFNPAAVKTLVNKLGYTQWAGDFHDGMNTAISFNANGLNLLVANVEWNGSAASLKWLDDLLSQPAYSNHLVIVAPHAYINAFGSLKDPRWSDELSDFIEGLTPILNAHSGNVFLTLNGHFATDCGYNTPAMIHGRNELMFDRQDCVDHSLVPLGRGIDEPNPSGSDTDKVGGATVTILNFQPTTNQIDVSTYDVFAEKWRDDPFEHYTIPMFYTASHRGRVVPLLEQIGY